MNKKDVNKGFTLVELIVVITIVAILGTIAFVSFQSYTRSTRDSTRIAALGSITKGLEIFVMDTGFYPDPDKISDITYSGAIAWKQGVFGDNAFSNVKRIFSKPVDPLYNVEYSYSIANMKSEYELATVLEVSTPSIAYNSIIKSVSADDGFVPYIKGNYNGKILQISSGAITNILAIPTILSSQLSGGPVEQTISTNTLVHPAGYNLPASYDGRLSGGISAGGFVFQPTSLLLFSGDVALLGTQTGRILFGKNLQDAYKGTRLEKSKSFASLMSLNPVTDTETLEHYVVDLFTGIESFPRQLLKIN